MIVIPSVSLGTFSGKPNMNTLLAKLGASGVMYTPRFLEILHLLDLSETKKSEVHAVFPYDLGLRMPAIPTKIENYAKAVGFANLTHNVTVGLLNQFLDRPALIPREGGYVLLSAPIKRDAQLWNFRINNVSGKAVIAEIKWDGSAIFTRDLVLVSRNF